MTSVTSNVDTLTDDLVAEISHNYGRGRAIVAVDGLTDTHDVADALADAFGRAGRDTVRASMRRFGTPRARWVASSKPGRDLYESAFDDEAFRAQLITPFRRGEPLRTAVFDLETDRPAEAEARTADGDAVLIVDGPFLLRRPLRGVWNYSLHLDLADRDHGLGDVWQQAQETYLVDVNPGQVTTANIDISDPHAPVRTFADSC